MQNHSIQHFPTVVHAFKKTEEGEVFVKQQVIFSEREMDQFREQYPGHVFRTPHLNLAKPGKKKWWERLLP